jgi:hypothetical protein
LKKKADSWWHDLSPSSRQDRLESVLQALKDLADTGLGAASVLANLHHQWIIPLMERRLRIFEMDDTADPVPLAQSRLLPDLLLQEGEARHQPQGHQERQRRPLVIRYAPPRPAGEWNFCPLSRHLLAAR